MAEVEYGGIKISGGKLLLILPLLGTLGGGLWAGFEFYKDYSNMKEIIANIDTGQVNARMDVINTKLDEALDYSRDIKNGLRDDIVRLEKSVFLGKNKILNNNCIVIYGNTENNDKKIEWEIKKSN